LEKRISSGTALTADMSDEEEEYDDFEYDAWAEEVNHGLKNLPFRILGTSADDIDSHPHVLSPPLMESLQAFMPMSKTSDNYWMKYSMVRDGASIHTLLQHARGAKYSVLAIETVDGEVMGSFTNEPWRKTWSYFGGGESFLWRMRHSRKSKCNSIIDVAHLESEIDVYPYTGENHCVQFCTSRKIAVGGGSPDQSKSTDSLPVAPEDGQEGVRQHDWGYGISLQSDLMHGSSSPCVTFGSPSLSKLHSDGSLFEIINIELWTMTPCYTEADAQKLELGHMFLEQQSFQADQSNEDLDDLFG
jgi:TLD